MTGCRIDISPDTLKAAHAKVTGGAFYKDVAKDLGISKSSLRRLFEKSGLSHHVGKERCAVFFNHAPKPTEPPRQICKTWAHDLSTEMLRNPL